MCRLDDDNLQRPAYLLELQSELLLYRGAQRRVREVRIRLSRRCRDLATWRLILNRDIEGTRQAGPLGDRRVELRG